tara:strand:- start:3988 stop:6375 length:2388 start_codon:yes stop_codon:yes gene_type:complete
VKISENWLREWVDTAADLDTISERVTMLGLEVDAQESVGGAVDGVVIGQVLTCEPHPDADKLKVCSVDTGQESPAQIVCGAPNVAAGVRVPVATPGTVMPSGMKIKAAKLRGVASNGMLCSAGELGATQDVDGLWLLPSDAPIGTPMADWLGLPDQVLDIDLTPNRGDCLSMRGVAREVALGVDGVLQPPVIDPVPDNYEHKPSVDNQAPAHCAAYAARHVEPVKPGAATPLWMRERLRRAGVRAINLPVDIGNYVMLELGQPMHAFDADRLAGGIQVRLSRVGEHIVTLDGEDITLDDDTLVIADDEGPVAIAGMIGGQRTAVNETTTRVLYESACFRPSAVAGRGRRYKIHTDSLHRFERGVDPRLHEAALQRASGLLVRLGGGACGPITVAPGDPLGIDDRRIELSAARLSRLIGQTIDDASIESILTGIGCECAAIGAGEWQVAPPSWRYDLAIEADLIEEIARVYGYDRLEAEQGGVALPPMAAADAQASTDDIAATLRQRGYHEAITYSFVEPELHAALTGDAAVGHLDNPIAEQMSVMRRTLWPGLLEAWAYNARRQQSRVRLFEQGLSFAPDATAENGYRQTPMLAGLAAGPAEPTHWDTARRAVDFFDVRGDVEALFAARVPELSFVAEPHPGLHPGRSARILLNDRPIGWIGQLAPAFARRFKGLDLAYLFEIEVEALRDDEATRYETPSDQPQVRRDLALVVAEEVAVGRLIEIIRNAGSSLLQSVEVFDVFRGQDLDPGDKSIALSLIFQSDTSTLDDEAVEGETTAMIHALGEQAGARLRGM